MSKLARTLLDVQSLDLRDMPPFFGGISLHGFGFSAPECKPVAVNCRPIKVIDCALHPAEAGGLRADDAEAGGLRPHPAEAGGLRGAAEEGRLRPQEGRLRPKKDDGKCDLFGGYEPMKDKDDKDEACGYGYKPNTGDKCDDKGDKDKKDDCTADLIKNLKAKACAVVPALCGIGHGW